MRKKFREYYKTPQWDRIRKIQLRKHILCEHCFNEKPRKLTLANTCDHINPDWSDWQGFLRGPFQSLCSHCHAHKSIQDNLVKIKARKTKITSIEI